MGLKRTSLIFIFFSHFWGIACLAQIHCINDTTEKPVDFIHPDCFIHGEDTFRLQQFTSDQIIWSKNYLKPYWKKGYALARWELQTDNFSQKPNYVFILDKKITKGKITGWDAEIMNPKLGPLLLNWKQGKLLQDEQYREDQSIYGIDIKQSAIFFEDSIAQLRVAISQRQRQTFDGIIGIQQLNNRSTLIGDFKMNWINAFKSGESFYLRWQRQNIATQRLEFLFTLPFLFLQPIGVTGGIDFYRKQNQIFQLMLKAQALFHLNNQQDLSSGVEIKNNQDLITNIFVKHQLWLTNFRNKHLEFEIGVGQRKVDQNNTLDSKSENQDNTLLKWNFHFYQNWTLKKITQSIKVLSMGYNLPSITTAEMLRIGGSSNIRGFNAESIFVKTWHGAQFEIGTKNKNIGGYVFGDVGYKNDLRYENLHKSFGVGSEMFRSGVQIRIEYGWGIFPDQKVNLRQGVLHLQFNQQL